jgi:hypothetical protein
VTGKENRRERERERERELNKVKESHSCMSKTKILLKMLHQTPISERLEPC